MYFRATSCENISPQSCILGKNNSINDSFSFKSSKHVFIISLSLMTPSARIVINSGIGFLTFGIATTILSFVYSIPGATILTDRARVGLEVSSETERTSAE